FCPAPRQRGALVQYDIDACKAIRLGTKCEPRTGTIREIAQEAERPFERSRRQQFALLEPERIGDELIACAAQSIDSNLVQARPANLVPRVEGADRVVLHEQARAEDVPRV